jgi:hypothetical protein
MHIAAQANTRRAQLELLAGDDLVRNESVSCIIVHPQVHVCSLDPRKSYYSMAIIVKNN